MQIRSALHLVPALGLLISVSVARAEGSGGSGGASGTRDRWPCDGCFTHVPASADGAMPLMVAFHGDEGDPESYIEWTMPDATLAAGYVLLALKCPRDEGCGGSWYQWEDSGRYDDGWVDRQVDAVEREYDIERNRIYLAGFSGGSYFLASYAPDHSDRFAGVLYMGGGSGTYGHDCPSCSIPAYFLLGGSDFSHIDNARDTEEFFRGCGSEVEFVTVPGVGHEIAEDRLPEVYSFFDARPHACRAPAPPPDDPLPGDAGMEPGPQPDAEPRDPAPGPAPAVDGGVPGPGASPERPDPIVGSCAATGSPVSAAPLAVLVIGLLLLRGGRRRAP